MLNGDSRRADHVLLASIVSFNSDGGNMKIKCIYMF